MSGAVIELTGLRKSFGERIVLNGADLKLSAGGSYVVTGDNGSGKTTLLRILAGLESAQTGTLSVNGATFSLAAYPDSIRRRIVYVHQHPYLFHTSIADNLDYGLRARGDARLQRERRVRDAIAWAGVGHLLQVRPDKLSGGEKQRVALARAKILNPEVLLLDEPTANLDADGRRQAVALIEKLHDAEATVVIACHDKELIGLSGMHRLHLAHGKLEV